MKITRQNYEIFAIDYLDNKLSKADATAFLAFLKENQDIDEELHSIKRVSWFHDGDETSFDFSYLRKDFNSLVIDEKNFDEICIAYHEGDLDSKSRQKIASHIGNDPLKKKKFDAWYQLRVLPDKSIVFENKSILKHKTLTGLRIRRIAIISSFAAAASLATIFMLRLNVPENIQKNQMVFSPKTETTESATKITKVISDDVKPADIKVSKKIESASFTKMDPSEVLTIAVIDTTSADDGGGILISMIDAKQVQNNSLNKNLVKLQKPGERNNNKSQTTGIDQIMEKGVTLYAKASRLTTNEIIQSGVKGINNLVETDLKFESQTDTDGRIVEYALSSESFNFKRKVNQN